MLIYHTVQNFLELLESLDVITYKQVSLTLDIAFDKWYTLSTKNISKAKCIELIGDKLSRL